MNNNSLQTYFENVEKKQHIVTVFMLTHKRPYYVKLAIESMLRQTYKDFYFIILDNMSEDETEPVVRSFEDERLIYVLHDGSLTTSNYEYAFELVKTKYIIVMHDDDVYEADYLETVVNGMIENPELVALSPTSNGIDSDGKRFREGAAFEGIQFFKNDEYFRMFLSDSSRNVGMVFPATIYNLDLLGNIYDYLDGRTGPAGDQFIWFEIGRKGGTIGVVGKPLINYRVHGGQESSINAGVLSLTLIGYLHTIDYYAGILDENLDSLATMVQVARWISIQNYSKKVYTKDDVKKIYGLIPKFLNKSKKCRKYIILFKITVLFPRFTVSATRIIGRIKKNGR